MYDGANPEQDFAQFFEKTTAMESVDVWFYLKGVGPQIVVVRWIFTYAVFLTRSVLTDFGLLTDFFCKSGLF